MVGCGTHCVHAMQGQHSSLRLPERVASFLPELQSNLHLL